MRLRYNPRKGWAYRWRMLMEGDRVMTIWVGPFRTALDARGHGIYLEGTYGKP